MRLAWAMVAVAVGLAGCAGREAPRIEVQTRVICPPVKSYSPEKLARAAAEMTATCAAAPALCEMMGDFLAARDAARACAKGRASPAAVKGKAWAATLAGMAKRGY